MVHFNLSFYRNNFRQCHVSKMAYKHMYNVPEFFSLLMLINVSVQCLHRESNTDSLTQIIDTTIVPFAGLTEVKLSIVERLAYYTVGGPCNGLIMAAITGPLDHKWSG